MRRRKILCGLLSGVMLLSCSGSALAASDSKSGYVDGMSCSATLTVSTTNVTATTKSVPANNSYIFAQAEAYAFSAAQEALLNRKSTASYEGYSEVSISAPSIYGGIDHGRGIHTVNSLTMSTYADS